MTGWSPGCHQITAPGKGVWDVFRPDARDNIGYFCERATSCVLCVRACVRDQKKKWFAAPRPIWWSGVEPVLLWYVVHHCTPMRWPGIEPVLECLVLSQYAVHPAQFSLVILMYFVDVKSFDT
jgi:hypothetical protein